MALLLNTSMLLFPLANFTDKNYNYELIHGQLIKYSDVWVSYKYYYSLFSLILMTMFLNVLIILRYKNRDLQMKLCFINIALMLVLFAAVFYYYNIIKSSLLLINSSITVAALFPVVSIILCFLAYKTIKKDDELVKSADRLR